MIGKPPMRFALPLRFLIVLVPLEVALASGTSFAGDDGQSAVAEALFRTGRELMAAGDYGEACSKFEASQRIDPKLGTLMNLALCHEKEGKTASAWAEYVQAAEIAKRTGQQAREQLTRQRAAALEPALPRVVISGSATPALVVTLDEKPIAAGAFGTPVPVDPGDHVLRATAPGAKPYTESFTVAAGSAEARNVHIPDLEPDAAPQPSESRPAEPARAESVAVAPMAIPPSRTRGAQRIAGLAVGATGVAGLVVGGVFGLLAKATYDHALQDECGGSMGSCTPAGAADGAHAVTQANVSTAAFIGGAVLSAGGAVLFFTAPTASLGVAPVAGSPGANLVVREAW
jgi:hypothetical protein